MEIRCLADRPFLLHAAYRDTTGLIFVFSSRFLLFSAVFWATGGIGPFCSNQGRCVQLFNPLASHCGTSDWLPRSGGQLPLIVRHLRR